MFLGAEALKKFTILGESRTMSRASMNATHIILLCIPTTTQSEHHIALLAKVNIYRHPPIDGRNVNMGIHGSRPA